MKNRVLLKHYFLPGDLEAQIKAFVEYNKNQRYHDADARTAPVRPPKPRQTNRGSLPKHLERVEVVIERLDIIPAQFRVIVTRRPKYASRSCEDGIT